MKVEIPYTLELSTLFTTSDTPRSAPPRRTACPVLPFRIISHYPLLDSAAAPPGARCTMLLALRRSSPIHPRSCTGRFFGPIRVCRELSPRASSRTHAAVLLFPLRHLHPITQGDALVDL